MGLPTESLPSIARASWWSAPSMTSWWSTSSWKWSSTKCQIASLKQIPGIVAKSANLGNFSLVRSLKNRVYLTKRRDRLSIRLWKVWIFRHRDQVLIRWEQRRLERCAEITIQCYNLEKILTGPKHTRKITFGKWSHQNAKKLLRIIIFKNLKLAGIMILKLQNQFLATVWI